jgi:hypothetical protein
MTRSALPITVAFAVSAGLLLTACGGGGSDDGDKIQPSATTPAPTTATPSTTPPPTTPATRSAEHPPIQLPSGARNVFEDQHTGNRTKDAVLFDNQQWVNSMDEAILKKSQKISSIGFYSTDKALEASVTYIDGYLKSGDTWVGVTRFFDRKVTVATGGSANLIYCSDQSKSYDKDKTGKVDYDDTDANSYVLYNTKLMKNHQGIWQTVSVIADRGAKQCQP